MEHKKNLSILVVDDEMVSARAIQNTLESMDHRVTIAQNGEEAVSAIQLDTFDLVITDLVMPGMDGFALVKRVKRDFPELIVFIFTGHDSFSLARKALTHGADDFLLKPIDQDQLAITINQAWEKKHLKNKIENLGKLVEKKYSPNNLVGNSPPMQEVIRLIEKAQTSKANVFIRGESGTGKELVAQAIYSPNAQKDNKFVSVNCCAISENLIESELFGHVRGAFSGATSDRMGLFEQAHNGTIFLDEIGDISLSIQMKLLRVIQEGEVRRVGENRIRHVDTRVIAATNKNLEKAIQEGTFREDLFYRLNVIPISLPSLRERVSDIPIIIDHFLQKHCDAENPKSFSVSAIELLQNYSFPGNIRELENIVQRAISFVPHPKIEREDIVSYLQSYPSEFSQVKGQKVLSLSYADFKAHQEKLEKEYLEHHLQNHGGHVAKAAESISVSRTAFHNRVNKLQIDLKGLRKDFS
jgi:DNA-binding NtrC family response regulator